MNRNKEIIKVSFIGIITNVMLVIVKGIIGFIASSIAIILDAINNLSDVLSSVITIIGAKLSSKAPDKKHPYGHGRIEYISALLVAIVIIVAGISAMQTSISKIINPTLASYSYVTFIIISITVLVKLFLGLYFRKRGKALKSTSLVGSGQDALFDSIISLSTLIAAIISYRYNISIEGYLGIVISIFIFKAAIEILSDTFSKIIGVRSDIKDIKNLKELVSSFDGVLGVYDIIMHSYGEAKVLASVNIQVKDEMTAKEIHHLTRRIAIKAYQELNIILNVGIYASNDTLEFKEIHDNLNQIIANYKHIIQVHGFYVDDELHLISFDVIFDFEETEKEKIIKEIENKMQELYPNYLVNIVVDTDYSDVLEEVKE